METVHKDGLYLGCYPACKAAPTENYSIDKLFTVSSTLFCCGGFIYKTQVERKRGIDALPGMTILSACLETVSIHH
ncbi:hypothetical protein GBA52_012030 [Prunus armeniaca]|nr:hypothetical protein GBA52_012030 [Prunus armeniaca]